MNELERQKVLSMGRPTSFGAVLTGITPCEYACYTDCKADKIDKITELIKIMIKKEKEADAPEDLDVYDELRKLKILIGEIK